MSTRPILVGITGGIGAGKSIAAEVFQVLGIKKYDSDSRGKWLMNHSEPVKESVEELFGKESYTGGVLNRKFIADQAFHKPELLTQLNEIVHPAVAGDFEQWVMQNQEEKYILKEAALLFETGSYQSLHHIILVTAPEEVRLSRVMKRDPQRSEKDIRAIMERQWTDEEKTEKADDVLVNDGTQLLLPQILKLHEKISQS